MPLQPETLLAIDPGTRELGFAVLSDDELLYYGVKSITNRKKPSNVLNTASEFINQLIEKYEPRILAIEKMFVTQKNSALLNVVAAQIKAVAEEKNLPIYEYAPTTVRKLLCQSGRATKRKVAATLSEQFPELRRYYLKTQAWEIDYYANLFDAVAVGVVYLEEAKTLNLKR